MSNKPNRPVAPAAPAAPTVTPPAIPETPPATLVETSTTVIETNTAVETMSAIPPASEDFAVGDTIVTTFTGVQERALVPDAEVVTGDDA